MKYRKSHAKALTEINNGKKRSHWAWWIWPTNFKPGSSDISFEWALSDEQAAFFMQDEYLRKCWLEMMEAVAKQLDKGVSLSDLCGIDLPRVLGTCNLMERVVGKEDKAVNTICNRIKKQQRRKKLSKKNEK
jgi:uncharacterized protein (DUF1810 family)